MAKGEGWSAGKIILWIFLGLVGLGIVCCGGAWLLIPAEVKQKTGQGFAFGAASIAFAKNTEAKLGKGYVGAMQPDDEDGKMVIVIGVPDTEDLTPERIRELQDIGWELYVNAYKAGGMPAARLAIGVVKQQGNMGGAFIGWRKNQVDVEELARRTGIEAPPDSPLFDELKEQQQREQEGLPPEEE